MPIIPQTEDLLGMGDIQRTNMWSISLIRKPPGLSITTEQFNLRCRTSGIPRMTMTAIEAYVRSSRIITDNVVYPDSEIEISFLETVDPVIRTMFWQWFQLYKLNQSTFFNRCGTLRLCELDNQQNEVFEHILDWAFIENYNPGELAGNEAGAELMFPSMTMRYNILNQQPLI